MKQNIFLILSLILLMICFSSCRKMDTANESTTVVPLITESIPSNTDSSETTESTPAVTEDLTSGTDGTEATESIPVSSEDMTSVSDDTESPKEVLASLREWFDTDYSYTIRTVYTDLGFQGFEADYTQLTAKDGSFRFGTAFHQWHHPSEYDHTTTALFYYCYEGEEFVCYRRAGDEVISRMVMSEDSVADLKRSNKLALSGSAILPEYLSDFHETTPEKDGERNFVFTIALKDVESGSNFLSSYFDNVFNLFGESLYSEDGLSFRGLLITDSNLHPLALSYEFSEIEPYVESYVVWSEEILGCLRFEYTFDFDLSEHIEFPEEFVS